MTESQRITAYYYVQGHLPDDASEEDKKEWIERYEASGRTFKERKDNPLKDRFEE